MAIMVDYLYFFILSVIFLKASTLNPKGFDLSAHSSNLLGGRRRRCQYVDHADF
jgi:hypothetical protein